ncbi:MAG TPA: hypothetical protein PKA58_14970 [Polyangium sp.]|nr:hypothetical protein [Polyangium sp.]
MRNIVLLVFGLLAGCGGSEGPTYAPPVDVVGSWTADFLLNTSTNASGPDVSPFGVVTLEESTFEEGGSPIIYTGKATAVFKSYAVQGTVDMPKSDGNGDVLYEQIGTVTYAGKWTNREDTVAFELHLSCQQLEITAMRPDVQAVCGAPGFEASAYATCHKSEGSATFTCKFGTNEIVFSRL